jgi:hypothetical protein
LARLIATARAEHDSDLVVRLKPGQDPLIVEAKNASKTTASKRPAPTGTRAQAPDHGARRTIAGRAAKKTGAKIS